MKDATCKLNSMTHRGRAAGFTLIEIMIAIGILVVGLTGVIALYAVAVDAHKSAVEQSGAAALAESMLSSITADFTARKVDDDDKATFLESYVDLCTKHKAIRKKDDPQNAPIFQPDHGIEAPNEPGFNCEVSIYPLPRGLWAPNDKGIVTLPLPTDESQVKGFDPQFRARVLDKQTGLRTWEEYQWDAFICGFLKEDPTAPGQLKIEPSQQDRDDLNGILAQALEYKVVVKAIRGEGVKKRVDIFETIITPRGIADKQVP